MTAVTHDAAGSRQRFLHLVAHEFRYDLRCFRRNTQSLFFTLILPVLLLRDLRLCVPQRQRQGAWWPPR
jgi:hypothetical protein